MGDERSCGTCVRVPTCYIYRQFLEWCGIPEGSPRAISLRDGIITTAVAKTLGLLGGFATYCRYYRKADEGDDLDIHLKT